MIVFAIATMVALATGMVAVVVIAHVLIIGAGRNTRRRSLGRDRDVIVNKMLVANAIERAVACVSCGHHHGHRRRNDNGRAIGRNRGSVGDRDGGRDCPRTHRGQNIRSCNL